MSVLYFPAIQLVHCESALSVVALDHLPAEHPVLLPVVQKYPAPQGSVQVLPLPATDQYPFAQLIQVPITDAVVAVEYFPALHATRVDPPAQ